MKRQAVVINIKDNVATVVDDVAEGTDVKFLIGETEFSVKLVESIPIGHKFAITEIPPGSDIIKYGESIGRASTRIMSGQYVHVHNMESQRGRGDWNN